MAARSPSPSELAVSIRSVGKLHAGVIAELQRACFHEAAWDATAIFGLLIEPTTFALIAAIDGAGEAKAEAERGMNALWRRLTGRSSQRPVGFALVRAASDEAEILSIGVLPGWRGRGIGAQLLQEVLVDVRRRGAGRLFLEVGETNIAAQRLYGKAGFVQVGRRQDYYRVGDRRESALVLRARL